MARIKELLRGGEELRIQKGDDPGMTCRDGCGYDPRTVQSMIDGGYTVFITRRGKAPARVTKKLLKEMTT